MDLKDKVVVITGGSQGLGRALATRLAREDVHIWVLARNEANLQAVVNEIRSNGGDADLCVVDVTSKSAVEHCVERVLDRLSRIDVLVNCAGIWLQGQNAHHRREL